jgi:hypothetical protein
MFLNISDGHYQTSSEAPFDFILNWCNESGKL